MLLQEFDKEFERLIIALYDRWWSIISRRPSSIRRKNLAGRMNFHSIQLMRGMHSCKSLTAIRNYHRD